MGTHDMYPLKTGYLTKSPPESRVTGNFKRWMRRWFVLWQDKKLEYYEDRGDAKPKKAIDLSRCEFLDTNLSERRFENIFSIKISGKGGGRTGGRTYYLAADSHYEMTEWVDKICNLCEFKATENNNNTDTKIRHQAPLDRETVRSKNRDSGIIVANPDDTSDLVPVHVVVPPLCPYDEVPPPRPAPTTEDNSAEFDAISYSGSSISSMKTDSSSDLPARTSSGGNSNYDCPPQPDYDVPSKLSTPHYDTPKGSCDSENGNDLYDYPPQQTYDVVPRPICRLLPSNILPSQGGLANVIYQNAGQEFPGETRTARPSEDLQQYGSSSTNVWFDTDYNTLPPNYGNDIYDHVPSRSEEIPTYDIVPRPLSLPSVDTSGNYDFVPPPVPAHQDNIDGKESQRGAPPVPRDSKPLKQKTYVNLTFPSDEAEYKKPLPSTPHEMQRDSGTDLDEEDVYDVPPVARGHPGPCVDRTNKPGVTHAPKVDRQCKPEQYKIREYVNLPPTRSVTLREGSNYAPRKGGNVQRSKSAAADFESEGYLYMESPKRTESSLRYSKKDQTRKSSFNEEEENESYEYMQRNGHDTSYENYDTPRQLHAKKESSPERAPLRGHYQDIDVVCQREAPTVPERSPRTQYTTIDLQKTKAFRKTCEDVGKGQ